MDQQHHAVAGHQRRREPQRMAEQRRARRELAPHAVHHLAR